MMFPILCLVCSQSVARKICEVSSLAAALGIFGKKPTSAALESLSFIAQLQIILDLFLFCMVRALGGGIDHCIGINLFGLYLRYFLRKSFPENLLGISGRG